MPKNKVVLQEDLSLSHSLECCSSEPQCEKARFEARWSDGMPVSVDRALRWSRQPVVQPRRFSPAYTLLWHGADGLLAVIDSGPSVAWKREPRVL